jgi:TolA-binding protein
MRQYRFFRGARLASSVTLALVMSANTALAQDAGERYAQLMADVDSLSRYSEHLQKNLKAQESRLVDIEQQLTALDGEGAQLQPMLTKMYQQLKSFVDSDLPFKDPSQASADHRADRMAKLSDLMSSETARPGEKFRRILEATQIEIEYGRSVASYKGKLDDGRKVDFVRFGRISLMYRTEDGEENGYWDAQQKKWVQDNDYAEAIETALQVAAKTKAPDLLAIPVPAPQEVGS